ncbi:MAG: histidine kinase [Acidobacteriota bacterium]|nr:histidine kinase [Acidobacteriota bacterium]
MAAHAAATLINWLGFITGAALYAMLLLMALGESRVASIVKTSDEESEASFNWLPTVTALLGLVWNLGSLAALGFIEHKTSLVWTILNALMYSALGFLPAVVVHSLLRKRDASLPNPASLILLGGAYGLSLTASAFHFYEALATRSEVSHWALHILTFGFCTLIAGLLWLKSLRQGWRQVIWIAALAWFAVSAQHLSHHSGENYSWWIEIIGHHASLPLAFVILYQDYRFALADLFLKRALVLLLLVACAFGVYSLVLSPLTARTSSAKANPSEIAPLVLVLVATWIGAAFLYPWLRRGVSWFVDSIILRRANFDWLRDELAKQIAEHESAESLLDDLCRQLTAALTSREIRWQELSGESSQQHPLLAVHTKPLLALPGRSSRAFPSRSQTIATVLIPTVDAPQYQLEIGELAWGRRLFSADTDFLETVATMAARRIDALRVVHERCLRDLREEEMHKLATEAELRALRAQINPHFLFNALTTIGYLIQASPDQALDTLMRLTALLRGVLRHSDGEFISLGEEMELVEAYLDIERARFEDRLRVSIDVPNSLREARVPALVIQPLVENAIKHGISPLSAGGEVTITARLARGDSDVADVLQITVRDTGAGTSSENLRQGRTRGFGLNSIEERLDKHFGSAAQFSFRSVPLQGTTVEISFPVNRALAGQTKAKNLAAIAAD